MTRKEITDLILDLEYNLECIESDNNRLKSELKQALSNRTDSLKELEGVNLVAHEIRDKLVLDEYSRDYDDFIKSKKEIRNLNIEIEKNAPKIKKIKLEIKQLKNILNTLISITETIVKIRAYQLMKFSPTWDDALFLIDYWFECNSLRKATGNKFYVLNKKASFWNSEKKHSTDRFIVLQVDNNNLKVDTALINVDPFFNTENID